MTAVMKAVRDNDEARVKGLIAGGADVDELDPSGDAPLVMAAYLGHTGIVRALLEAGADVRAVDPGMPPPAAGGRRRSSHPGGCGHQQAGGRNGYTALHDAIWENHVDTARVIIEAGADLTLKSHRGETPLDFARAKRRSEIVTLIEHKLGR